MSYPLNSNEEQQLDKFIGLDRVKADVRKIKARVGLGKTAAPTVTGANDAAKLASLISALTELGIVKS